MTSSVRPESMQRITTPQLAKEFIDEQVALLREQIGDKKVLLALSGGVDSSVVAALLADEFVGFIATSKSGREYEAIGKLEQQTFQTEDGRVVRYVGFKAEFGN